MSSKTKIVVLRMKEIIYTAIFVGLGLLLITLFLIMFRPGREKAAASHEARFVPGIYTASIILGGQEANVEVCVDSHQITSVTLAPLSEAVTTMYPLMQPSMENLAQQIVSTQSTENLTYSDETRFTSSVLIQAVDQALKKAVNTQ
ncbi:MAG TPA: hypothetical protein H9740_04665 [Candidatus Hungatella pullicola]|nr:hypothetical protein [Candidatus Hungatella pullicola]